MTDVQVSEREAEVLSLLGEHLTNAEIAARLFISVRTVESHVSALLRKLDVADRRALAQLAQATAPSSDGLPAADVGSPRPLPSPLTSFVGRQDEQDELVEALGRHRLVTAVGPGGVGKTRLALAVAGQLAGDFAEGVWYVDLVPVSDGAMVGAAVATALGFDEQVGRSPTDTIAARFADAEALLVLDNCEHVVAGVVEFVERLLSACPGVRVLATSQLRLLVPFEMVFTVPGLALDSDAVALFVERATMAGWTPAGSPDERRRIAELCQRLDGSALAIELAAARIATFGLDGLEAGLANRLEILTGGPLAEERHRSVRSAVDWSYDLLDPADQAVLRRAAVFVAPFGLDAAATVVGDEPGEALATAIGHLADHSLLTVVPGPSGTRYRMLETIRQYGEERLAELDELRPTRDRHLAWCLTTAESLHATPDVEVAVFDAVVDDLRAALAWAAAEPDGQARDLGAPAYRLATNLAGLSFLRGRPSEAQRLYEQAAALTSDDHEIAEALHLGAVAASCRLVGDEAVRLHRAAAEAALRAGDTTYAALELTRASEFLNRFSGLFTRPAAPGQADELLADARALAGDEPEVAAAVLSAEGEQPDREHAMRAVEFAERSGDARLLSAALDELTVVSLAHGDTLGAREATQRRLEVLAPLTLDMEVAFELSDALHMAPMTSIAVGLLPEARRYAEQRRGLHFYRQEDHLVVNWVLITDVLAGDWAEAERLAQRFRTGWEQAGRPQLGGFAVAPAAVAMMHGLRGDDEARREWLGYAAEMGKAVAHQAGRGHGFGPLFEATVELHRNEVDAALATLADDPESLNHWHTGAWRQWYAAAWAEAATLAGHPEADERRSRARAIVAGNPIATALADRADALAAADEPGLLAAAAALAAAGCAYQQARTLVLAGRDEGRALFREMGATL